jgi:hypothetical protein
MVPVAQQRRIPFLVDIAAADPITANVAKAVREGQQKVQYVYRNFPTGTMFGQRAVQFMNEIFKEAGVSPKRLVLMYANDLFGQNQARSFQAAQGRPAWDIVESVASPADLSPRSPRQAAKRYHRPIAAGQRHHCRIARQRVEDEASSGPEPRALGAAQIERSGDLGSSWTTCPGRTSGPGEAPMAEGMRSAPGQDLRQLRLLLRRHHVVAVCQARRDPDAVVDAIGGAVRREPGGDDGSRGVQ